MERELVEEIWKNVYNINVWKGKRWKSFTSPSPWNIISLHFYLMPQIKDMPLRFSREGELQHVKSEYFSNKNLNNKAARASNEEI